MTVTTAKEASDDGAGRCVAGEQPEASWSATSADASRWQSRSEAAGDRGAGGPRRHALSSGGGLVAGSELAAVLRDRDLRDRRARRGLRAAREHRTDAGDRADAAPAEMPEARAGERAIPGARADRAACGGAFSADAAEGSGGEEATASSSRPCVAGNLRDRIRAR